MGLYLRSQWEDLKCGSQETKFASYGKTECLNIVPSIPSTTNNTLYKTKYWFLFLTYVFMLNSINHIHVIPEFMERFCLETLNFLN